MISAKYKQSSKRNNTRKPLPRRTHKQRMEKRTWKDNNDYRNKQLDLEFEKIKNQNYQREITKRMNAATAGTTVASSIAPASTTAAATASVQASGGLQTNGSLNPNQNDDKGEKSDNVWDNLG